MRRLDALEMRARGPAAKSYEEPKEAEDLQPGPSEVDAANSRVDSMGVSATDALAEANAAMEKAVEFAEESALMGVFDQAH